MDVHIVHDLVRCDVSVYLIDKGAEGDHVRTFYTFDKGAILVHQRDIANPAPIEPALRVDMGFGESVLKKLTAALVTAGYYTPTAVPVPDDGDVRAHLADAVVVRDRLLTMVEKGRGD